MHLSLGAGPFLCAPWIAREDGDSSGWVAKAEGRKAGAGCEPVAPRKGEPVVQLWA